MLIERAYTWTLMYTHRKKSTDVKSGNLDGSFLNQNTFDLDISSNVHTVSTWVKNILLYYFITILFKWKLH